MPGATVYIPVRQGGRECPVRPAPLVSGRVGVDCQPGQRVAELHRAREQRDQSRALGVGQRGQVDPGPRRGLLERRQIGGVTGRGEDQSLLRGPAELARAVQERLGDLGGHQDGRTLRSQRQVARVRGEFEQRQRVAGRGPVQQRGRLGRQPRHELGRFAAGQAADLECRQVGAVEQGRLTFADGDEYGDRVGHQPAEREQQCLRAGNVEPLGVVHQHGHRFLLGKRGKHAQRGGAHGEPLLRRPAPQRQRALQRDRLRLGDLVEHAQGGAEQFQQGAERYLRL